MQLVKSLKPKDIIAIIIICIAAILMLLGRGESFSNVIALIVGYYFAHRLDGIDKGV